MEEPSAARCGDATVPAATLPAKHTAEETNGAIAQGGAVMAAVLLPTRHGPLAKLRRAARVAYLRWLIRHAEADLAHLQAEQIYAATLDDRMRVFRQHIEHLTVRLIDAEAGR